MSERQPQSPQMPYLLPNVVGAQEQISLIHQESEEQQRLHTHLLELEAAANAVRSKLGKKAIEPVIIPDNSRQQNEETLRLQREKDKKEVVALIGGIDLPDNNPIVVNRLDDLTHDFGGYYSHMRYVLQKTNGFLFIETTDKAEKAGSHPSTMQYFAGEGMAMPLLVKNPEPHLVGKAFLLHEAKECSWSYFKSVAKDALKELETERLILDSLALVVDEALEPGRFRGESFKTLRVEIGEDQYIEVYAGYIDHRQGDSELHEVGIEEYTDGKRVASYRIDAEKKTLNSYSPDSNQRSDDIKSCYRKSLGIVKELLDRKEK